MGKERDGGDHGKHIEGTTKVKVPHIQYFPIQRGAMAPAADISNIAVISRRDLLKNLKQRQIFYRFIAPQVLFMLPLQEC